MGLEGTEFDVHSWTWRRHTSKASGKEMLACTYYGGLSDKPVTEYFPVLHDGYAGDKAMRQVLKIASSSGANVAEVANMQGTEGLSYLSTQLLRANPPKSIEYRLDGKFYRVIKRSWE
jgi:hypothetical protein